MRIGLVGGLSRDEGKLVAAARAAGHTLERHSGELHGRASDALRSLVDASDLLILVTQIKSHNAMHLTKRLASERGRPLVVTRSFGLSRLRQLLGDLALSDARSSTSAA